MRAVALARDLAGARLRALLRACGLDPEQPWWLLLLSVLFVLPQDPGGRPWRARIAALLPHVRLDHPGPADLVRVPLQLLWLALVKPPRPRAAIPASRWLRRRAGLARLLKRGRRSARSVLRGLAHSLLSARRRLRRRAVRAPGPGAEPGVRTTRARGPLLRRLAYASAAALAVLCITTPFGADGQLVFLALLWLVAVLAKQIPGQAPVLLLILLSIVASTRYIWWRAAYTLNWDNNFDLLLGLVLFGAELYAWLMLLLGYFQTAQPLRRDPVPMPPDRSAWPCVDVFIPTYNEPLKVVKPAVIAAQAMDWPANKLNVYILDDGRREEFRRFAEEMGVGYMVRPDNRHAKAGNLNHALTRTSSEFVAIFDCDHIPTRSFLQRTLGWFLRDKRLALVQTPHHMFSPDPFERNLGVFGKMPSEGELFHGLIQDGNDLWNATFFCGSCAVLRRGPLEEIGGIAVETVTEDAHTALKLQRRGYATALLNIPLAAGLATESLSAHVSQRIRWARGMAQIFRLDNPLTGKGLNWAQRVCYSSAMLHFFNGAPRLVFLTAPLAFLLLHAYVIHAAAIEVALYVLPHLIHAQIASSRLQGRHRRSFWAEVYETVLAWYIVRPTTVALLDPHKGKFNVTPKGGLVPADQFDWSISRPYLALAALNLAGFCVGLWRIGNGPPDEVATTILNMSWTVYNLILLGAALAVAAESRQLRSSPRAPFRQPASLHLPDGARIACLTEDLSDGGVALRLVTMPGLGQGDAVRVALAGDAGVAFPARVMSLTAPYLRLRWELASREQEVALVECGFGRPDAWSDWSSERERDHPLASLGDVMRTGVAGYGRLGTHALWPLMQPLVHRGAWLWEGTLSLLPRSPLPAGHPGPAWVPLPTLAALVAASAPTEPAQGLTASLARPYPYCALHPDP